MRLIGVFVAIKWAMEWSLLQSNGGGNGVCCNQMGDGMEFVAIKWGKEMRWNEVGCFSTASPPPDSLQSTSFFFNWESVQWFLVTKGPATVHNDPICSLTHN